MKINEVSNEDLKQIMDNENIVLLDVREVDEYTEAHIPDAILIPLGQLESRYDELDKERNVFVICHSGGRSKMACQILQHYGFQNVANVVPGMISWDGEVILNK